MGLADKIAGLIYLVFVVSVFLVVGYVILEGLFPQYLWILWVVVGILIVAGVGFILWITFGSGELPEISLPRPSPEEARGYEETYTGAPEPQKVPPLTAAQKERGIRIVGTRCSYPNCNETVTLDVHHIIPRTDGGSNKDDNLIVLCPTHHRKADRGMIPRERLKQYSVAKMKRVRE